jgi:hypothetical protein
MRIVSEKSEADLARERASDQVAWKIRELTANLLRITRGAGKPDEITMQMNDLAAATQGFWDAFGLSPYADEFPRALDVSNDPETTRQWRAEDRYRDDAEERIIRGVLQVVASRLVRQKTQETIGRHEMYDGINALEDIRAEARKARAQAAKDVRQATSGTNAAKRRLTRPKAKVGRPRKPA